MEITERYFSAVWDARNAFFFSNTREEALAVRAKTAVISPLVDYGLIRVAGLNAKVFLQGQLSCDLNTITETDCSLGAYCTVQGRVQSLFTLFLAQGDYFLLLPTAILDATLVELKKYGVFSKVAIDDVSDAFSILGLYGAPDQIKPLRLGKTSFSENPSPYYHLNPNNNLTTNKDNGIILVRAISTAETTLLYLIIPKNQIELVWNSFLTQPIKSVGSQAWQLVLIEQGMPTITEKTMNEFLPHFLNLPELHAVSFKKGCYRGQEIVTRMQFKGNIKKHLYCAHFTGVDLPSCGMPVLTTLGNKEAGQIVNAVFDGLNQGVCLLVLADQFIDNTLKVGQVELTDIRRV